MNKTMGNFFPLPNEIFELGLPSGAFHVYCFLCRSANRRTHQCYPSYKTIGKMVGMSKNTVRGHMRTLEDKGLIITENTSVVTRGGMKRNGTLLYTVLDPRPVLEAHRREQLHQLELQVAFAKARNAMGATPTTPVGQA